LIDNCENLKTIEFKEKDGCYRNIYSSHCSNGIIDLNNLNKHNNWWISVQYYINYCGERLTFLFGITSPKYDYILNGIKARKLYLNNSEFIFSRRFKI